MTPFGVHGAAAAAARSVQRTGEPSRILVVRMLIHIVVLRSVCVVGVMRRRRAAGAGFGFAGGCRGRSCWAFFVPGLAGRFRPMHDTNGAAAWLLLSHLSPIVG